MQTSIHVDLVMQVFVSRRHSLELLYVSCASLRRLQNDEQI
jgi:hypothetical protein